MYPCSHLCLRFLSRLFLFSPRRLQLELRLERFCGEGEVPLLSVNLVGVCNDQNFFRRARLQVGLWGREADSAVFTRQAVDERCDFVF